ncbi:hypothetical protein P171DRAFT_147331 [Karstenula rhodostoma CBS 690.94]|uniref:Uncharacterized protein n=1 Tax=Karstenula rhodostoma CBS 690.94 TaxID=1392251 RepID=A0A9P4UG90_9PLEO|nr:hypothetical protein P171DRAFT_147331 [Karstenula rhodostoma CBS 690.94]
MIHTVLFILMRCDIYTDHTRVFIVLFLPGLVSSCARAVLALRSRSHSCSLGRGVISEDTPYMQAQGFAAVGHMSSSARSRMR